MAATTTFYEFFGKLLWGGRQYGEPAQDAVGTFPPTGSVVAIDSCLQAATLSFNHTRPMKQKHYGMKYVSGDSVALGVVGGSGCPTVAASTGRFMMEEAKKHMQADTFNRVSGMGNVLSSTLCHSLVLFVAVLAHTLEFAPALAKSSADLRR